MRSTAREEPGSSSAKKGVCSERWRNFPDCGEKVKKIEILGCGAAYITPGCEGRDGDGNVLCSRLATIAQTFVRASTATQEYSLDGCDFGPWEGTVLTYGPTGAVVKVEQDPKQ